MPKRVTARPGAAAAALVAFVSLVPSAGRAQAGHYAVATSLAPFARLAGGTPVGVVSGASAAGAGAVVPLGFSFTFFGAEHSEAYANTHGQLLFGSQSDRAKPFDGAIGDPAAPNGWVSPWWSSGSLAIVAQSDFTYRTDGVPGDRVAVVQWEQWGTTLGRRKRSMQVALREATRAIELRYGPIEAGASYESAVAGAEDPAGAPLEALACNASVGYGRKGCISNDWPAEGTVVTLTWTPDAADLVAATEIRSVAPAGNDLAIALRTRVRNVGGQAADGFGWDFYAASGAPVTPANSTKVGAHAGTASLAPGADATFDEVLTVPRPSGGELLLAAVLDPASAVAEASEANNTAVSQPLAVGVDLVAQQVAGAIVAGVGEPAQATVKVFNRGTDAADAQVALFLVEGATVDSTRDPEIGRAAVHVGGAATVSVVVSGTVPADLTGAIERHWAAVVDPGGAVPDAARANNTLVSGIVTTLRSPDLRVESVVVRGDLYFGEPVTIDLDVVNGGEAAAHGVTVGFFLSDNAIVTLNDRLLGRVDGLDLPVGATVHARLTLTLPETLDGVRPYPANDYWFGGVVDPLGKIAESNEGNNARAGAAVRIRPPAPDLVAVSLEAPVDVSPGELFPFVATIANRGNRASGGAGESFGWAVYYSRNELPSLEDAVLPVLGPDGAPRPTTLALGIGASQRIVGWTRLPEDAPPGVAWLGLLVDPERRVAELDDLNDAVRSVLPVRNVSSGVAIEARAIADALVGASFFWTLAARGCAAGCTWSLVPGSDALPAGLSLSASGEISGAPTQAGNCTFTVEARAGTSVDFAAFALRVFEPGTSFAIVSSWLPDAVADTPYGLIGRVPVGVPLAAVGGVRPYTWTLAPWTSLPEGLSLADGRIVGTPAANAVGTWKIQLEVWDAVGSRASAMVPLRVRALDALSIDLASLPVAQANRPYAQQVPLTGGRPPVVATVAAGTLPAGLRLSTSLEIPFLFGTPAQVGVHPFTLRVEDATGAFAERAFVLLVAAPPLGVEARRLPEARRGAPYQVHLAVDQPGASFQLTGGALPPGLTLSASGDLSGTPAADALAVAYDFEVRLTTRSGAAALAYTIAIRPEPRAISTADEGTGCGCGTGATGGWGWGLLGLGAVRSKRRRSV